MLALIHHHCVPVTFLQVALVLSVALEGVDGDDHPVEEIERVHVRRDLRLHALDPDRVEADKRNREAGPELLLELAQDRLQGDYEDAVTPTALN